MRLLAITLAALFTLLSVPAFAGNCDHPDDRAADGSRCGGRASSERPGGR